VEAKLMREVLLELANHTEFEFWLYGVTDPLLCNAYLAPLMGRVRTRWFRPKRYAAFVRSLENVAVGLHPICQENAFSKGKSFGKILAYMAAQVPIVTSREVDHPLLLRDGESAALIENNDLEAWVSATRDLVRNRKKRDSYMAAAAVAYEKHLTTSRAAERLDLILRRLIA
jgi:glycosyltransferase involved in cell wall biosynthesis